jgi:hypothetical protein
MSDHSTEPTEQNALVAHDVSAPSASGNKLSNETLLPFKAIHGFIMSLNEEFGTVNKPLRLYARLIEQTTFSHEVPIRKHVQGFTQFCVENREAIYTKDASALKEPMIRYSDRVYLNLSELFSLADNDQRKVMWQHLLTISALVDTTGRAKQILKESASTTASEANFLSDIIEKVEKNVKVDQSSNPFEAIGQIMNSGIFSELIGSMNDKVNSGQLDLGKMMGVVQSMVSTMSKDNPQMGMMFDTLMKTMDPAKLAEQFAPPGTLNSKMAESKDA